MQRVVHFDIMAEDPHRAIEFYSEVFGWEFERWDNTEMEYWTVSTGAGDEPGIDGGLSRRQNGEDPDGPANAFVCAIGVEDVEAAVTAIEAAGGVVTTEVMDVDGTGKLAYCRDTEGNQFCIRETIPGSAAR